MESPGSYIGAIIGMIIVGALITVISFDIHKDMTIIDTRVETVDGKTYDCTEANSHTNGMTYIRKPYYITMPSRNIKLIKRIKL